MIIEGTLLIATAGLLYWILVKKDSDEKLLGIYTQPGKWYELKRILFFIFLKIRAHRRKQEATRMKENVLVYAPTTESGVKPSNGHASAGLGIKSHQYLRDMETTQILANDDLAIDCIYFNGLNAEGTYFLMRIARRPHRQAEIWLSINIVGVGFFQSPAHPDTMLYNVNGDEFNVTGLKFECLIPMKRWKITFNGLLRKGKFNTPTEIKPEELCHVRFSFIWSAFSNPFDFDVDIYPGRLAEAIAREKWSKTFFDNLKKTHQTHYEQWGELFGVVEVEGGEERTLYMRGYRDHSYGVRDWYTFHRYAINFAYLEDSVAVTYYAAAAAQLLTPCKVGGPIKVLHLFFLSSKDGNMYPVTWTDMDMLALGENIDPPNEYTFNFTADGKNYKVHTKLRDDIVYYMHEDRRSVILEHVSEYTVNGVKGYGIFEFLYRRNSRLTDVSIPQELPMLREPHCVTEAESSALSLSFEDKACTSSRLVGGKGCQLAHLTQLKSADYQVPKGFCLTIAAFERQLSHHPQLLSLLNDLHSISTSSSAAERLKSACDATVEAFRETPLCLEVTDVIQSGLGQVMGVGNGVGGKVTAVAVRSSAAGEDGSELSAAGQMTTYLGLTDFQKICEAVRNCWASHFDYPAVMYRRQHGQPIRSSAGVVIQRMAPCKAAGVLFTRDPINGNPGVMIINANFGLGESVVSGEAEPDQILIRRGWADDDLQISKREIGSKKTRVSVAADGGTEIVSAADGNSLCCLPDQVILKLANIGVQLEKRFGDPRDIEFAVDDKDQIYLLQARPITSLDTDTEWQMMHEFDTGMASDVEIHTTANIQEMMPGAVTPLTISFFIENTDWAGQLGHVSIGLQPSVHSMSKFLSITCCKAFINLTYTMGNYEGNSLISDKRMVELSVLGETLEDYPVSEVESYNGRKNFLGRLAVALKMIKGIYEGGNDVDYWVKKGETLNFIDRNHNNAQELYNDLSEEFSLMGKVWDFHIRRSMGSAVWSNVLMSIVSQKKTVWTCEHFSDVALMLSKCSDVYSADVPSALKRLALSLYKSEHKEKFLSLTSEEAVSWLQSSGSGSAGKDFEEFLVRHGHRCVREAELRETSWRVEPVKVVRVIQSMMQTPLVEERDTGTDKEEDKAATIETIISQLKSPLTSGAKMALRKLIPKAQKAVGQREHAKSVGIKISDAFKLAYRKLARMMVQESRLPDEDLIYFLTHREIGQVLHARSAKLVMRAQKRRQMLARQMDLKYPRISRGHPKHIISEVNPAEGGHVVVSKISGMPVSQGVITGTARVVTSLQEASAIKNGEILIVPYTDVGWSPYFPMISGLATEIGGLLSHGAVVAREYGLPCVVNLPNATSNFKSGDKVILNGTLGTLEKVEER